MKSNCLFFLFVFTLFLSYGQESKTKFGIRAGANYSSYTPEFVRNESSFAFDINAGSDFNYEYKAGYFLGTYMNVSVSEKLKFQPELQFAVQGTGLVREVFTVLLPANAPFDRLVLREYNVNVNETTLVIPLNLQYYFTEEIFLEAGPQIGYILKTKVNLSSETREEIESATGLVFSDFEIDDFDNFDFGVNFGAGYNIAKNLDINMRYFLSINQRNNSIRSSVISLALQCELFN